MVEYIEGRRKGMGEEGQGQEGDGVAKVGETRARFPNQGKNKEKQKGSKGRKNQKSKFFHPKPHSKRCPGKSAML